MFDSFRLFDIEHKEGGDTTASWKSPGVTRYESITLERGVTHNLDFENWANKVWHFDSTSGTEASLRDFRKDVILELFNETGQLMAYKIYRCWVSGYQALPELHAYSNAMTFE